MRWDPLPWLLILVLALLGGVAWLTQFPDSPVLDRLAEWPVIGPAAERFREIYRPPPPRPAEDGPETEMIVVGRELVGVPPPASAPLGTVWLRAGTELRAAPEPTGEVVETLPGIHTMTLLERRGEWRRVARVGLEGRVADGWVRQADLAEPTQDELWRPEPVLPLAATPPPAEILAQARELMRGDARELPCGPFLLLTDAGEPLRARCPRLAGQLDRLYAERTGLEPVGEPREAILLFAKDGAFLIFRTRISPESRRHAFAAPARGFVAIAAGDRPVEQVQATLVHELVHLLNRRYLGPALPSWLDEGLAEDLAMSRIGADGTLVPGSLGSWEVPGTSGSAGLLGGGQVVLDRLRAGMRRGELETFERLVGLDRAAFQAERAYRTHYALSAFWVRYLLSGESAAGREGFRAFLAAVAARRTAGSGAAAFAARRRLAGARERLPPLARRRRGVEPSRPIREIRGTGVTNRAG